MQSLRQRTWQSKADNGEESTSGTIVVLQGPVGGFFGALARRAQQAGFDVVNVHFNWADRLFKSGGRSFVYNERPEVWPSWLERLCLAEKPRAILLFGDRRPVHITACEVAKSLDIPIYSFEEGYLRPDFVTLERGGNNARSPLPRDPAAYQSMPGPEPEVPKVGQSFWSMTAAACGYFVAIRAGRAAFPHYRHHRARPLRHEALSWLRNVARKLRAHQADARLQARLVRVKSKSFFVVALQVHDDLQAVHHGAGWSQEGLIKSSIQSFAEHAPGGAELVLRCHPHDRGHRSYVALVGDVAARAGVSGRVHLMQGGHGPTLLLHAAGLVTVNSTMALSALHHGCPVYALGDTFYRIPGLVAEGDGTAGLNAFLAHPEPPNAVLVKSFAAHLRRHTLIPGSFYRRRHWPAMVQTVLHRLAADSVIDTALQAAESAQHAAPAAVAPRVHILPADLPIRWPRRRLAV